MQFQQVGPDFKALSKQRGAAVFQEQPAGWSVPVMWLQRHQPNSWSALSRQFGTIHGMTRPDPESYCHSQPGQVSPLTSLTGCSNRPQTTQKLQDTFPWNDAFTMTVQGPKAQHCSFPTWIKPIEWLLVVLRIPHLHALALIFHYSQFSPSFVTTTCPSLSHESPMSTATDYLLTHGTRIFWGTTRCPGLRATW